jgi:protein-tyrosine phosphatase
VADTQNPVRILLVCMGNICRSPTAEAVLRALAVREAPGPSLEFDSAGTHGYHVGEPPDPRAQTCARAHGYELAGLRARRLVAADFQHFDYILVADRANLHDAQALAPAAPHARLQLLLDFAPGQPLRELPDPYQGTAADFERVVALCEQAAQGLLAQLRARQSGG